MIHVQLQYTYLKPYLKAIILIVLLKKTIFANVYVASLMIDYYGNL